MIPLAMQISIWDAEIWYLIPLVFSVSMVYGATRHEHLKEIFTHVFRAGVWLTGFLGVIFLVVWWATLAV